MAHQDWARNIAKNRGVANFIEQPQSQARTQQPRNAQRHIHILRPQPTAPPDDNHRAGTVCNGRDHETREASKMNPHTLLDRHRVMPKRDSHRYSLMITLCVKPGGIETCY